MAIFRTVEDLQANIAITDKGSLKDGDALIIPWAGGGYFNATAVALEGSTSLMGMSTDGFGIRGCLSFQDEGDRTCWGVAAWANIRGLKRLVVVKETD